MKKYLTLLMLLCLTLCVGGCTQKGTTKPTSRLPEVTLPEVTLPEIETETVVVETTAAVDYAGEMSKALAEYDFNKIYGERVVSATAVDSEEVCCMQLSADRTTYTITFNSNTYVYDSNENMLYHSNGDKWVGKQVEKSDELDKLLADGCLVVPTDVSESLVEFSYKEYQAIPIVEFGGALTVDYAGKTVIDSVEYLEGILHKDGNEVAHIYFDMNYIPMFTCHTLNDCRVYTYFITESVEAPDNIKPSVSTVTENETVASTESEEESVDLDRYLEDYGPIYPDGPIDPTLPFEPETYAPVNPVYGENDSDDLSRRLKHYGPINPDGPIDPDPRMKIKHYGPINPDYVSSNTEGWEYDITYYGPVNGKCCIPDLTLFSREG